MHDCMGVVYQNKKTNEASAPPELAATHHRDTCTGAFHSQQLLAERPSCFRQYGAIIISRIQIVLKKRWHHFIIQASFGYHSSHFFPMMTCFIQSQKCSCIFKVLWVEMSSMLPISLCRSSETSLEGNNNGLRLRHQWHVFKYMEMCWCRHHWEWQHPGILIWDLICKFQSTVVVITDFLCREIYIFNFHIHVSISDHLNLLLYSSWNLYRIQEYEKIDGFCFLWLSLQKGHFF